MSICELCGEPMPPGEEMFKFHGYSCDCPKPPKEQIKTEKAWLIENAASLLQSPSYWIGGNAFSPDHGLAIRFSREIDAKKAAQGLARQFQLTTEHRVAEHVFNEGAPLLNANKEQSE